MAPYVSRHHPLIGTVVEVRVDAPEHEAHRLDER
jgi:hypothetical protein